MRRRTARLSDDELRDIVTTHRRAYRRIAVELAEAELSQRGLSPVPVVFVSQRALNRAQRPAPAFVQTQTQPGDGLTLFCEIVCATLSSILLAIVFVSERETQKAILRWAGTSLVLPYTVWRGGRMIDQRWPPGGVQQGQATN
ncbi:MAG: hypothetical protein ACJ74W_22735 [Pyrinomonadaceae bacterium]